jgi:hypothetical protein
LFTSIIILRNVNGLGAIAGRVPGTCFASAFQHQTGGIHFQACKIPEPTGKIENLLCRLSLKINQTAALAAPKMHVGIRLAIKAIGLSGNGELADQASFHKKIEVPINGTHAQSRVVRLQMVVYPVCGRVTPVAGQGIQDHFPLAGVLGHVVAP